MRIRAGNELRNFDLLVFLQRWLRLVKVLLKFHLLEIFNTIKIRQNSPSVVKDFMQVIVVLLHSILSDFHVLKNSTKLTLNPLVISINFLVKTEEKLTISHNTGSSGLRIFL